MLGSADEVLEKRLESPDFSSSIFREEASNSRLFAISCGAEAVVSAAKVPFAKKTDTIARTRG